MVKVPSGEVNVLRSAGMSQLTTPFAWLCFAEVSVSDSVVPPVGVNENVMSNAVGTNTAVLPIACAGVNSPLPFTDTSTCWPPQIAVIVVLFLALVAAPAESFHRSSEAPTSVQPRHRLRSTTVPRVLHHPSRCGNEAGSRSPGRPRHAAPEAPRPPAGQDAATTENLCPSSHADCW